MPTLVDGIVLFGGIVALLLSFGSLYSVMRSAETAGRRPTPIEVIQNFLRTWSDQKLFDVLAFAQEIDLRSLRRQIRPDRSSASQAERKVHEASYHNSVTEHLQSGIWE